MVLKNPYIDRLQARLAIITLPLIYIAMALLYKIFTKTSQVTRNIENLFPLSIGYFLCALAVAGTLVTLLFSWLKNSKAKRAFSKLDSTNACQLKKNARWSSLYLMLSLLFPLLLVICLFDIAYEAEIIFSKQTLASIVEFLETTPLRE